MTARVPAVRIMVFVPRRCFWAVHKTVTSRRELEQELAAVADRRVKLVRATTHAPREVLPQYVGPITRFREEQAKKMLDRADAKKRYKSPG